MLNKLRLSLACFMAVIGLIGLTPAMAHAVDCTATTAKDAIQCGVNGANGGAPQTSQTATDSFNNIVRSILNILSAVAGIIAVIMIITAGLRFTTSGGNQERVKSARNALMYAVVGIAVVALAQIIVQFVLDKTVNNASASSSAAVSLHTPEKQLTVSTSEYIV